MHHPPHPGLTIREDILPALGITVIEAAIQLGVSRFLFARVINGKAAISPDMALRIERWLGVANGGSAGVWLGQQIAFNQWQTRGMGSKNQEG